MSESKTYTPLTSHPKNDFPLVPASRGTEKRLHALQVTFAGVDLNERKLLCDIENWDAQQRIPELSRDLNIGVDALSKLHERTEDDPAQLQHDFKQLVDSFKKEHPPVEFTAADSYWFRLAKLLLKGFEAFCDGKDINADDLDFKQLQAAYNDFF